MENQYINRYVKTAMGPCLRFANDDRCRGCALEHHPHLNPGLLGQVEPRNYRVPNDIGVACQSCIDSLRECDKQSRDPSSERDPCSECRHFGGEKARCSLAANTSYNDGVYRQMLTRRGEHEYRLPAFTGARTKGPMPAERVKTGWQGQSADALRSKGDILPPGVRDCPRAFIVPPREGAQRARNKKFVGDERPRSSQASSQPFSQSSSQSPSWSSPLLPGQYAPSWTMPPSRPMYVTHAAPVNRPAPLPPATFGRPPTDPGAGEIMYTAWDYNAQAWFHMHENMAVSWVSTMPTTMPPRQTQEQGYYYQGITSSGPAAAPSRAYSTRPVLAPSSSSGGLMAPPPRPGTFMNEEHNNKRQRMDDDQVSVAPSEASEVESLQAGSRYAALDEERFDFDDDDYDTGADDVVNYS
ncbi:hypothetical protein D6D08_05257 [Aureobasidium pullulans]|nr:hypothetical protein D6D08_05257 [Aureobasidium pullulans]